jgi:hypothetical protein
MLPASLFGRSPQEVAKLSLRVGIAFVFLYAAVASTVSPENWVGYLPDFVKIIPERTVLLAFSAYEVALAIWIATGRYSFYSGLVAAGTLLAITATNFAQIDVTFRDIGLALAAVALALL